MQFLCDAVAWSHRVWTEKRATPQKLQICTNFLWEKKHNKNKNKKKKKKKHHSSEGSGIQDLSVSKLLITLVYAFKSLEERRINYFSSVTREMCGMKAEKVKGGNERKPDHLFIQVRGQTVCGHLASPTSESHRLVPPLHEY